jgi:lysozyme family protein
MATHDDFLRAFELLVGHEGGFTDDPRDTGSWTGGNAGAGQLKGRKYGISAASYPNLDIKNLQLAVGAAEDGI